MKHLSSMQELHCSTYSSSLNRQMFHGKGDANTIRRLADDEDDDEENVSNKWEEPMATKVTTQNNSVTTKETSNSIKTGTKRPLSNHVS